MYGRVNEMQIPYNIFIKLCVTRMYDKIFTSNKGVLDCEFFMKSSWAYAIPKKPLFRQDRGETRRRRKEIAKGFLRSKFHT